jgi:hypothetical protein
VKKMKRKRYIFRWKDIGGRALEVTSSEADSLEEVWEWALKWMRGPTETSHDAAPRIREQGEVVEVER